MIKEILQISRDITFHVHVQKSDMTTTEVLLSAEVRKKNTFIEFLEDIEENQERKEPIDDLTLALNDVMYESEKRINRDL